MASAAAWPTATLPGRLAAGVQGRLAAGVPGASGTGGGAARGPWSQAFRGSQHCVIVAVDITGSAAADRRDDEVKLEVRDALYGLLVRAFGASAIPWDRCLHEDRGDGVLVIIPARLPTISVVNPLLGHLQALLRRHNRLAREPAQIRLRVAVHVGEVHRDRHGLAGVAVNHAFRLLEAPVLKQALASRCAELALIVSDYVYESVIRHSRALIDSAAFQPVTASVKETRARAWILLPGSQQEDPGLLPPAVLPAAVPSGSWATARPEVGSDRGDARTLGYRAGTTDSDQWGCEQHIRRGESYGTRMGTKDGKEPASR